jgi:ssDNA-specific exonuclease RecJ
MQLAAACGVSTYTYRLAVRIFEELGLMQTKEDGVYVPASPEKRSLEDSETFRRCSGK